MDCILDRYIDYLVATTSSATATGISELFTNGMAEVGAGDISHRFAIMQDGFLAQHHMLRVVKHQTY